MLVVKARTLEAKTKAEATALKAKARALKAEAKAKDMIFCPRGCSRPRPVLEDYITEYGPYGGLDWKWMYNHNCRGRFPYSSLFHKKYGQMEVLKPGQQSQRNDVKARKRQEGMIGVRDEF